MKLDLFVAFLLIETQASIMNHRYIQWEGESAKGRRSQKANKPEGERAKGRISQAQGANEPGGERARRRISQGRTSQGVKELEGEQARGEPAKGQKSHNPEIAVINKWLHFQPQ